MQRFPGGTVNGIYIGQMLGVKALAAVTVMFPVLFFLIAFIISLGAGVSVLIGEAWGAKNVERVQAVVGTALIRGWGGLPQLGIARSARDTMVAYFVALLWLGTRLLKKPDRGQNHPMAPNAALLAHLCIEPILLKGILKIGIPIGLHMVVIALANWRC